MNLVFRIKFSEVSMDSGLFSISYIITSNRDVRFEIRKGCHVCFLYT